MEKLAEFDPKLRLLANGTPIVRKSAGLSAQKAWEGKDKGGLLGSHDVGN